MATTLQRLKGRHKRLRRATPHQNTADDAGTVQVSVILIDPKKGQHQVGNITKAFRIGNCRVSEVAYSLEQWLFAGGAQAPVPHVTL